MVEEQTSQAPPFRDVVSTEERLRELYRPPSPPALGKQIDRLDDNCRSFIEHSPFVLIATSSGDDRSCDVSPKGGPPGFVRVLDEKRLAIPDLAGNNRLDSFTNLLSNTGLALLFLIPGLDETLRVNGRAWIVTDDDVLDACVVAGRRPKAAVGMVVEEAYIHCAKAFRRGSVWQPEEWPDRSDMPTIPCMLRDHLDEPAISAAFVAERLEEDYATTMW